MRRTLISLLTLALLTNSFLVTGSAPSVATPVALDAVTYTAFGRVFPDPHGCLPQPRETGGVATPNVSPWAKGRVCAGEYIQFDEAIRGLIYLQERFPRYVQVINLAEQFGDHPAFADEEFMSAGVANATLERTKRPLYVVKVTDVQSPRPERERRHFAYSLSIHGIERAGLEGGLRAIEDIVTWAACEDDIASTPACAAEGPFPRQILEPLDATAGHEADAGPTAGEVVDNGVLYFMLANPDGWARGEYSQGGVHFQRYNGNGVDLNRDWPTRGYTYAPYTPWSEPESRGFGKFLAMIRDNTAEGRFAGGLDLHGMATAKAFSYTLLGSGQRDYRKNAVTVDTSLRTFRDSETRLAWSPMIAPAGECPVQERVVPAIGWTVAARMCSDQWGTVWDTIDYQVTGSFGDWMDSPMGLDAIGINNEMAYSHLAPGSGYDPDLEQLHIDGNKGLIFSLVASLLFEEPVEYVPSGDPTRRVGYIFNPRRIQNPGTEVADPGLDTLPTQGDVDEIVVGGVPMEFEVRGPNDGYYNGGMTIRATYTNAQGINATGPVGVVLSLDHCDNDHPGITDTCDNVANSISQELWYSAAGAQIDVNAPKEGTYRVRASLARVNRTNSTPQTDVNRPDPMRIQVEFKRGVALPVPQQAPYDVSSMDFFTELNQYVPEGSKLAPISVDEVLTNPTRLREFDTVVAVNQFMPGTWSDEQRAAFTDAVGDFAESGGNVVLTDGALNALPTLTTRLADADKPPIPTSGVREGRVYAGYLSFNDGAGTTYARHHLAADVAKPGTAEGTGNRHQMVEPVPIGYELGAANPEWAVVQNDWNAAGGSTAGRASFNAMAKPGGGVLPNTGVTNGVGLGELPLGAGRVRIVGTLLPDPSEAYYHPFGLSSYALTYTAYEVFENLVTWENPARIDPVEPAPGVDLECGACSGSTRPWGTVPLTLNVANVGNIDDTFALEVLSAPLGWGVSVEPTTVSASPGVAVPVQVTVTVPRGTRRGTYEVTLRGTSGADTSVSDTATYLIEVKPAK